MSPEDRVATQPLVTARQSVRIKRNNAMVSGISVEEQPLQKERVRVYALARELDVESKDLLDLCRQAGFDVKNQLSNLEPEQVATLKELIKRGSKTAPTTPMPAKSAAPVMLPEVGKAMPNL